MKKKRRILFIVIGCISMPIIIGLYSLGMFKFFSPKYKDVERNIFENTKSYIHGVQQDLGKYYLEYQTTDEDNKMAIRTTIQMRFAEVDVNKLQSNQLRSFLIQTRGY